jgi:hypothetical protein
MHRPDLEREKNGEEVREEKEKKVQCRAAREKWG